MLSCCLGKSLFEDQHKEGIIFTVLDLQKEAARQSG